MCAFFRASQYQVQVGVSVGDETLHTVQAPALVGFIVSSFQHDALQVTTGIGFGQVHRHGFAGTDTWDETAVLVFVSEFVEGFDTVLQRPDVSEARIGLCHDFGAHGVGGNREVQSSEAAWHGHAVQPGFHHGIKVLLRARSIFHPSACMVRTFQVYAFGIGCNHFSGDFAGDFQHFVV